MRLKLNNTKNFKRLLCLMASSFILSNLACSTKTFATSNNNITKRSVVDVFSGNRQDYLNSMIKTQDGGYVIVGYTNSEDLGFENTGTTGKAVIMKYNKNGDREWFNYIGSSNTESYGGYDKFNKVIETKNGDFIAVGVNYATDLGFQNNGGGDAIIVKYDSKGNQLWATSWGGSDEDEFLSVIEMNNENIVVVGTTASDDTEFGDQRGIYSGVILQYDKDGNKLNGDCIGGIRQTTFKDVLELDNGDIMVMGYTNSSGIGFETNNTYFKEILLRYNNNCVKKWIKCHDNGGDEFPDSMIKTSKGEIFTVARNQGAYYAVISKYDENGTQIWTKNFGERNSRNGFSSIIELKNGNLLVCGYINSSGFGVTLEGSLNGILVEYDTDGNIINTNTFGKSSSKKINSVIENEDGDILMLCEASYSADDLNIEIRGAYDALIVRYNPKYNEYFDKVNVAESNRELSSIDEARGFINSMDESVFKKYLQDKLNNLSTSETLELKTASANLDLYIKSENILMMSLDTSSITFEDFSGVEDVVKTNAVNVTISSSLPYQLNAYLPVEIQNADKSNTMDKSILNIKENSETTYQTFANTIDKIILKDNCPAGNDLIHGVDIKLKGGIAHEKDVYKTTIKFEAEQK